MKTWLGKKNPAFAAKLGRLWQVPQWRRNKKLFQPGHVPWHKGKHVKLSTHKFTAAQLKELWKDPEFRRKNREACVKALHASPNRIEKKLLEIVEENSLPFQFTGNGSLIIDRLNPDFIATDGSNRIIEVFGRPFHDPFAPYNPRQIGSIGSELGRKAFFKARGWDMMVIWGEELENSPDEVRERIIEWDNWNFEEVGEDAVVQATCKISSRSEVSLGKKSALGDYVLITVPRLVLDDGAQVNAGTCIVGKEAIKLGRNSTISYNCTVLSASDTPNGEFMNDASPESKRDIRRGQITIGDDCFVGAHSIIMPGVEISNGTVVRAFSYVDKLRTEPYSIYGGQPARFIRKRNIGRKALKPSESNTEP